MALATADKTESRRGDSPTATRVAYLVSRFPKLTETFVLYEVLAMQRQGVSVSLYPLRRERDVTMHAEAQRVVDEARFTPLLFSWAILAAHLHFLVTAAPTYLRTLCTLLWANLGSRRYFTAAVVYFPKAVLLAREFQRQRIEHVHAHFANHPAAVAFVIGRLTGIPFSFTAHGSDLHRDRHMLAEKVGSAKLVIAISQYNRDLILRECGDQFANKVRVVHCGVDTDKFALRGQPTPFDDGRGPFTIVCTGTLHEVKGQRYLLEACGRLRDEGLSFRCHFVGDGPDRDDLERLAETLALTDHVVFEGKLPQHELRRRLADADVLAAPSVPTKCGRREGIPVALMEAMSCGIAVVASRLSGIPELVEHERCGLLVEPRDADGLAAALTRLYRDHAFRQQLAQPARRKVESEFDLTANAQRLAQCFQADAQCLQADAQCSQADAQCSQADEQCLQADAQCLQADEQEASSESR